MSDKTLLIAEIEEIYSQMMYGGATFFPRLAEKYKQLISLDKTNKQNIVNLILLLCHEECWDEAIEYVKKSDRSDNQIKQLIKLINKFKAEPFCNIYNELIALESSENQQLSMIIQIYIYSYSQKQAEFLSKLYKSISIQNLLNLIQPVYSVESLNEYLSRYGFEFDTSKKFVNLKSMPAKSATLKEMVDNLKFINETTIQLENLVKANPSTFSFPN